MGGAMKCFLKKLLDHEILDLWSPGLRNVCKNFVKLSGPPPTYLMYAPLVAGTYSNTKLFA